MTISKRIKLSLLRNKGKTILLFFIIFLLGILLSSAFSFNNAVNITQNNLRAQMPAITGLMLNDENMIRYSPIQAAMNREQVTHNLISKIGNLPYIQAFDFNLQTQMKSASLYRAIPEIDITLIPEWMVDQIPDFQRGMRDEGGQLEIFIINGITNPELTDIDAGLISLIEGRVFTQEEINNGHQVAIISSTLATRNDLTIGSTLTFENNVYDELALLERTDGDFFMYWHLDEFVVASQLYELEVIGIFDVRHQFDYTEDFVVESVWQEFDLHNRIYIPTPLAESAILFGLDIMLTNEVRIIDMSQYGALPEEVMDVNAFFLLYDPRDASIFIHTANEMLPEGWEVRDFSGIHASMTVSLTNLNSIAENILVATIVVGILVLTLVVILFLGDRKNEIGIYMALGERKQKIITQIILEITIIFVVAMICSLIFGAIISNTISSSMVEQELRNQIQIREADPHSFIDIDVPWFLMMFNPGVMTFDAMIETFDTSLSARTVVLFFAVGGVLVSAATIAPIIKIMRLEPREVLTISQGSGS